jgi:hypothetical protein
LGLWVGDLTGQLSNPQPALCHLADQVIHPSGEAPKANQLPAKPIRRPRFQTRRRLAADQIAALVEAYRSGKTMKELASEFGIHRTTVSSHLNEHGCRSVAEGSTRNGHRKPFGSMTRAGHPEGWASGSASALTRCSQSSAGPEHRSGPDEAGHPA